MRAAILCSGLMASLHCNEEIAQVFSTVLFFVVANFDAIFLHVVMSKNKMMTFPKCLT